MTLISDFLQTLCNGNDQLSRLLLSLFVIIFTLSCCALIYTKNRKDAPPLPPGPRGLPLVGNLLSLDPELHSYFARLAQAHGPILKLWLGKKLGIVVSSPTLAREVLKDNDLIFANRDVPAGSQVVSYGGSDIVWTPYGPEWPMLRKVCVLKMLSNTTLNSIYMLRRKQVRETVVYFYSRAGSPVNVGEQMYLMVLKVITNML